MKVCPSITHNTCYEFYTYSGFSEFQNRNTWLSIALSIPANHGLSKLERTTIVLKNIFITMVLLLLVFAQINLKAQIIMPDHGHDCMHPCAHAKTSWRSIGIYDQDPRLHDYDVKFYGLDLDVNPATTFINGSARILAEVVVSQMDEMVLELTNELTVSQVIVNGESLSFTHENQNLIINLNESISSGSMIDAEVFYSGEPQPQGFFSGISSAVNSFGDPVLWTLSEPHNARQWFPCKQVLEDKADSVHVTITTPPGFIAASNGLLTQITELPDGRLRYYWKSFYPIAYYLISMAVSNYQEYNFYAPLASDQDSVFIQNFLYNYPQVLEQHRQNLELTKDFMQLFSQIWGDYPFSSEKYGHAQAPMGGAMEHQTLSTMGGFNFNITAHELAHHWFGNHVTLATWSDIWINEGFASYGEYLAREFIISRDAADEWMANAHDNIKSQPGGSIYVPPYELSDIWRIFNGRLSYRKGAAMLHLLRFELDDDELFFHIKEDFQQTFAHSVASGDDFRMTIDLNTGENWEWFFDQWYYGEGFPIYELVWWQDEENLYIRSSQTTSADFPAFFKGTLEFKVVSENEEHIVRVFQDEILQVFQIPMNTTVDEIIFDPRSYMLKQYVLKDSTSITDILPGDRIIAGPNPVSDYLIIKYPHQWDGGTFYISDLQGRKILKGNLKTESLQINLQHLNTGIYLLNIISKRGQQSGFKLLKK